MKEKRINKLENKKRRKKIILSSILGVFILLGGILGYFYSQFHHVKIDKSDEELGINTSPSSNSKHHGAKKPPFDNQIINIALFGVDRRDESDKGRADSTMILTIDYKHKKLKLSSLMRDMYLKVDGHGKTKFNHAYAYGGAPLAIKTINQTFGTDIRDYVTVDFFTLEKIIDEIGGVQIDVKEEEYPMINKYIKEVSKIENEEPTYLTHPGLQTLNGRQAVAYARIRKVGNGDFERTERQRRVLSQMVEKLQNVKKSEIPGLVMKILPYVETSLSANEIISMGREYVKSGITTMEQDRFPRDGYWHPFTLNGVWYMKVDLDKTREQIQDFIYEISKDIQDSHDTYDSNSTDTKENDAPTTDENSYPQEEDSTVLQP